MDFAGNRAVGFLYPRANHNEGLVEVIQDQRLVKDGNEGLKNGI